MTKMFHAIVGSLLPRLAAPILAIALAGCEPMLVETPVVEWSRAPIVYGVEGKARTPGGVALSPTRNDRTLRVEGTGQFLGGRTGRRNTSQGAAEDGVTLNFVNAPVAQAAKVVLGDIYGVDYVIDPKIEGKISIHTAEPVDKGKALALFRTALRSTNAELVDTGGVYRIMPADQAASAGLAVRAGDEGGTIGGHANVVQLKYVSAAEMKRVLEPIGAKGAVVRADEARGALTLTGSPQEIATLKDAIRLFDVDAMRGMSFALVPVRSSDPDVIAEDLRKIFSSESEGPMNGMVRFVPNKRLKSILVISPQQRYLARAENWIRRLDARAAGGEKQFYTYPVQNRPAKELATVLNSMFSAETTTAGNNRQIAPRHAVSTVATPAAAGGAIMQPASASVGVFGALGPTSTEAKASPAVLSGNGRGQGGDAAGGGGASPLGEDSRMRISADDSNNSLLILASPDDYRRLMRVIQNLDVMPNQVLLEATIAEVTLNDNLKFGVQWYLGRQNSHGTFTDAVSGAVGSLFPGFSYALKLASVQATLNALQQITDVNIVSSPSLMVMDNKTATLQVGDQVPITTQSAVSVLATGAPIVNSVTYKDTGIILSITPRINDSGRVMLEIEQEVSSVVPTTSSNIDSPTIQQRRVKTTVVVNDREPITLGGLLQEKNSVSRNQLPVLGDIPLLGNAFKSKNDLIGKTELILFVTPRVVRNLAEAQEVTDEFRQRLNFVGPRLRVQRRDVSRTVQRTFD